jgi:NADH-quinone oxidoreductase subunit C
VSGSEGIKRDDAHDDVTDIDLTGERPPGEQDTNHRRGGPGSANPNMAGGEAFRLRDQRRPAVQLSEELAALRDHIVAAFDDLQVEAFRGELTLVADPDRVHDLLAFCRDDPDVRCELLSDLSGVHWPGVERVEKASETTGWPSYSVADEGRIEIDYILTSITHNHRLRVRTALPDDEPSIRSVVDLYRSADFMEREVYDMFGVVFPGHPNLARILMPEEWVGHPHRKDYPLGGVEVQYKGAVIPPPDQRSY